MAVINTNYLALVSQSSLQKSQSALGTAVERLSSGLRLNRAQDDSAGLAISQRLMEQVRGISPVVGDANNAISLTQVAEGSLGQVSDALQRMRDLAVQSANDTNNASDRESLQAEFSQLSDEIDRIAETTQYNGQNLLDGSFTGATFQVGGNNISIGAIADTQTSALGRVTSATATAENRQGVAGLDITTEAGALEALDRIDAAITSVVDSRSRLGASTNRIQVSISNLNNSSMNLGAANSRIRDVDVAEEASNMARSQILSQPGLAVLAQANALPQLAFALLRG